MVRAPPAVARASARLTSDPVDRSSTTSTSWPSARSRSTRVEPMNPAPPVTIVRIEPAFASPGTRSPSTSVPDGDHCAGAEHRHRADVAALARRSSRARAPTRRPSSRRPPGRRPAAPSPATVAPGSTTQPAAEHRALHRGPVGDSTPSPSRQQAPTTVPVDDGRAESTAAVGTGGRPGTGGPAASALHQVAVGLEVGRRRPGVEPVGVVGPGVEPPSRTMAGKVSRSIDTRRPVGIRPSTEGSST